MFKWNSSFSVGNEDIDEEHKELFRIIHSLDYNNSEEKINTVLDDLLDYISYHFSAEEALMNAANFEHYNKHMKLHKEFIKRVTEAISDFSMGHFNKNDLRNFLNDWLLNHIKGEDSKYSGKI